MNVKINPVPKPRMTRSDKWNTRPCVVRYRDYCDTIRYEAVVQKFKPSDRLYMKFVVEMPKSWSKKKKKEMNGKPHQSRPDVDNMTKAIMDALLDEDSSVYEIVATKLWGEEGEVHIHNLDKVQVYLV